MPSDAVSRMIRGFLSKADCHADLPQTSSKYRASRNAGGRGYRRRRPRGHGLRAASFAVDRRSQPAPSGSSAHQRKYLRSRKSARSRAALSFGRAARSTIHEGAAARIRERSPARRRSREGRRLLPDTHRSLPASHHASAAAGSRQLRDLHQSLREVARGQSGRSGDHDFHGLCRRGTAL